MEWMSVTVALAAVLISLLAYWTWKRRELLKTFESIGLPGPPPRFFTGNALDLQKKGTGEIFFEWRAKYGRFYGAFVPFPTVVVTDPEILHELMVKRFSSFPNRSANSLLDFKPWSDSLLQLQDDHWRHSRNQLSPTFSSGKLKKLMPVIDLIVGNLSNYVKEKAKTGEEVELKQLAGSFTMDTIAAAAFGMQIDSLANPNNPFYVNGQALLQQNTWLLPLLIQFPQLSKVLCRLGVALFPVGPTNFFMRMVEAALADRRQEDKTNRSDFLQLLVDAEKEGGARGPVDAEIDHSAHLKTASQWNDRGLNDNEVKANAMLFFVAGYETTSVALSFTLFHLAANPDILRKAQDEVDEKLGKSTVTYETAGDLPYLEMCLNESMRMNSPVFLVDREAVEDTQLGGYPLKKGTKVMIPIHAIHTDPNLFPEPEKFLPERHSPEAKAQRHPFAFIPFGQGPRNCIGMRMAQLKIRMALATVLQHYSPVLCDKSVYPPRLEKVKLQMAAVDGMWVKFIPRG